MNQNKAIYYVFHVINYHASVIDIYGCLLNSENRRNDKRNQVLLSSNTERHLKDLIDSGEKGIDIPFFDLESVLAATNNFSDANKLGQGGYGPVYKVISLALIGISGHVS